MPHMKYFPRGIRIENSYARRLKWYFPGSIGVDVRSSDEAVAVLSAGGIEIYPVSESAGAPKSFRWGTEDCDTKQVGNRSQAKQPVDIVAEFGICGIASRTESGIENFADQDGLTFFANPVVMANSNLTLENIKPREYAVVTMGRDWFAFAEDQNIGTDPEVMQQCEAPAPDTHALRKFPGREILAQSQDVHFITIGLIQLPCLGLKIQSRHNSRPIEMCEKFIQFQAKLLV